MNESTPTLTDATRLQPTVGLFGGIMLAVGIVVGAGLLALPGLVYREAGGYALGSWLLDALLVAPLLVVFATLGRRFPTAGGVSGFVGGAFPWAAIGTSYLLVGTFALGLPSIALTGAMYVVQGLDLAGEVASSVVLAVVAGGFLLTGLLATWAGAKVAGTLQNMIVVVLVGLLIVVAVGGVPHWNKIDFSAGAPTFLDIWSGAALAFFAFTGWEMLAFTAEEFKKPRRDFPIALGASFIIVVLLYLGIAAAVQALVPLSDSRLSGAPFLAVVETLVGHVPAAVVIVVVTAIIVVNLNGACWAASRLIFDIGRRGWAPSTLQLEVLSGDAKTPRRAVLCLGFFFVIVLSVYALDGVELEILLLTAGQNFFILYLMSVAAFTFLAQGIVARVFGVVSGLICLVFAKAFGWGLIYAVILFGVPYACRQLTIRRKPKWKQQNIRI